MDHSTAQSLMAMYARIGAVLNEADTVIRTLPEAERSEHLRGLAETTMQIWFKLQLPIVREHRELDPDKAYFQEKSKE